MNCTLTQHAGNALLLNEQGALLLCRGEYSMAVACFETALQALRERWNENDSIDAKTPQPTVVYKLDFTSEIPFPRAKEFFLFSKALLLRVTEVEPSESARLYEDADTPEEVGQYLSCIILFNLALAFQLQAESETSGASQRLCRAVACYGTCAAAVVSSLCSHEFVVALVTLSRNNEAVIYYEVYHDTWRACYSLSQMLRTLWSYNASGHHVSCLMASDADQISLNLISLLEFPVGTVAPAA